MDNPTQPSTTQLKPVQLSPDQPNLTQLNPAQPSSAQLNPAQCSSTWLSSAQLTCSAQPSSPGWPSSAQLSTAQPSSSLLWVAQGCPHRPESPVVLMQKGRILDLWPRLKPLVCGHCTAGLVPPSLFPLSSWEPTCPFPWVPDASVPTPALLPALLALLPAVSHRHPPLWVKSLLVTLASLPHLTGQGTFATLRWRPRLC